MLGLDFHVAANGRLAVYEPGTGQWLQTPAESAEVRAEEAEARVAEEATARQKAEAEVARLQKELERLRARR